MLIISFLDLFEMVVYVVLFVCSPGLGSVMSTAHELICAFLLVFQYTLCLLYKQQCCDVLNLQHGLGLFKIQLVLRVKSWVSW